MCGHELSISRLQTCVCVCVALDHELFYHEHPHIPQQHYGMVKSGYSSLVFEHINQILPGFPFNNMCCGCVSTIEVGV